MADEHPSSRRPQRSPADARRNGRLAIALAYFVALSVAFAVALELRAQSPLVVTAAADLAATIAVFAFSVFFDNSSIYDPYWGIAPIPITFYWLSCNEGPAGPRQIAAVVLVCFWGTRLTGNWIARWRGLDDEDFRYAEIRQKTGSAYWPTSFLSIHLLPTILVFLGLLPLFPVLSSPGRPLGWLDGLACLVTVGAFALETSADRQLRTFVKHRANPADILDTGLWSLCRHPNYLGELLFWWGLFLFGMAANPGWVWAVVGPLSITLLFAAISVPWMDRRMLAGHPAWAERMRNSPALIPFPSFARLR